MNNTIKCQKCGNIIDIDSELKNSVKSQIEKEFIDERNKLLEEKKLFEEQKELARKEYCEKLKQDREKIKAEIEKEKENIFTKTKKEALTEAAKEMEGKIAKLNEIIQSKEEKIKESQKNELSLLEEKIKLQEKERELELRVQKEIAFKMNEIRNNERTKVEEENKLKVLERDKKIQQLVEQVEHMRIKLDQTSSQKNQGDILEEDVEIELKNLFPNDKFESIKNGAPGGDLIQKIKEGKDFKGRILWEMKNTQSFSNAWIEKIKKDANEVNADVCIIVTKSMPNDSIRPDFHLKDGVIIVGIKYYHVVALLIRQKLIQLYQTKLMRFNSLEKQSLLYEYIVSQEFTLQSRMIFDTLTKLNEIFQQEKVTFERNHVKKIKNSNYILELLSNMLGSIENITEMADVEEIMQDPENEENIKILNAS